MQGEIKAEVTAICRRIVNLYRDGIGPGLESRSRDGKIEKDPFLGLVHRELRNRIKGRVLGEVIDGIKRPVHIDGSAIVTLQPEKVVLVSRRIGNVDDLAKISRGVFVVPIVEEIERKATVENGGILIAVSVAKFSVSILPATVVKADSAPSRALIAAIIEVVPIRTGRNIGGLDQAGTTDRPGPVGKVDQSWLAIHKHTGGFREIECS